MRPLSNLNRSFEPPQTTALLLVVLNGVAFLLCVLQSRQADIPIDLLFRYGAIYHAAVERQEYWRFIAHGFLHANPLHIATNLLCLILWGGLLEKRVGALYFILIYGAGLVGGAGVSLITHAGPYLSVGASGAISAVLGGLLSLRLMGKIGLPGSFFVINIGLNIALAAATPKIDWGAHLGGFVAGAVCCGLLDIVERALGLLLRCKFPEFVKVNFAFGFVIIAAYCLDIRMTPRPSIWISLLAAGLVGLVVVKALDLILSLKKGLAVVVIGLALMNAALVLAWSGALTRGLGLLCEGQRKMPSALTGLIANACVNTALAVQLAAVCVWALTMLLYGRALIRGMADVGFVGSALRVERGRHRGL
jgi:membrane associated rhomboid family serine protease